MTSHREAPAISKDPVADNTDLYAFVSPDKPSTVTLIANYIPLARARANRWHNKRHTLPGELPVPSGSVRRLSAFPRLDITDNRWRSDCCVGPKAEYVIAR